MGRLPEFKPEVTAMFADGKAMERRTLNENVMRWQLRID